MKSGMGFGVVVVGLVLLWLVVTGRTGNFTNAWRALQGGPAGTGQGPVGPSGAPPTWAELFGRLFRGPNGPAPTPPPVGQPQSWVTPSAPPGFGTGAVRA